MKFTEQSSCCYIILLKPAGETVFYLFTEYETIFCDKIEQRKGLR